MEKWGGLKYKPYRDKDPISNPVARFELTGRGVKKILV